MDNYVKLLESLYYYMQENVAGRTRPPKTLVELMVKIEKAKIINDSEGLEPVFGDE